MKCDEKKPADASPTAGQEARSVPPVAPGDWITFGQKLSPIHAVVCTVHTAEFVDTSGDIEVVYLDERNRAINTNVRWVNDKWEFVGNRVDGGYADRYQRLREWVQKLRRGRYR